jgi:hypothetical protein
MAGPPSPIRDLARIGPLREPVGPSRGRRWLQRNTMERGRRRHRGAARQRMPLSRCRSRNSARFLSDLSKNRAEEAVGQWLIGLTEVTVDQSGKSDMVDGEVADTAV